MTIRMAAAVAAAIDAVVALGLWGLRLTGTKRGWVHVDPLRRLVRAVRTPWLRATMWLLSWPHLVDVVLRTHRRPVAVSPMRHVSDVSAGRLYRLDAVGSPQGDPVLLVHAFVTQPWILDLLPGRSLIEALAASGRDVYVLDWPDTLPNYADMDLAARVRSVLEAEELIIGRSPNSRLHLAGYCSGANAALLAAALVPERRRLSLVLIAPVGDTLVPGGMGTVLRSPWLMPPLLLDASGCVPAPVVREGFHSLRPEAIAAALARWRMRGDRPRADVAAALTRWTWEQRSLPGALFFDLVDFYRSNALVTDEMVVGGQPARIAGLCVPTVVAVTDRDHIVPVSSSLALERVLPSQPEIVRCAGGHVSMLCGSEAQQTLFPALADWLSRHDATSRVSE